MEIECLQKKNAAMAKLREEIEKKQKSLRMECEAFEKQRARNLAHFEDDKKEETRKLQRERKLFEKHATAVRATPNRTEGTEIRALKEQLSSLQEELRKKKSSWSCTHTRLLQDIDSLSQENLELKDQLCTLKRLRVISLLKKSLEAESNTKYVSSVSKGDKLASPLDSRGSIGPPRCSTAAAARGSSKDSRHPDHEPKAMENSLRKPSEAGPSSSSSSQRSAQQNVSTSQPIPAHSHSCSPPRAVRPSKPTKCSEEEDMYPDGKVVKFLASGAYIAIFPNGMRTKLSSDGTTLTIAFAKGDTLDLTPDHRVRGTSPTAARRAF
ncbi:centromere protein J-like isoform X2 [Dunckerocampus dactyliophorus]|uniref:centromere protein J-like isoform X2 n=1 Tax=Dunckerocampus dactyliophorus TaxID=161453 RepID=UPI002406047C|nr:centromere protein J-like isoform X2 [Dunckerocampus dactyliophorus]